MHRRQRPGSLSQGAATMHPTGLMDGTRVGDWRVLWRHEVGSFGVVYLAVRVGHEAAGPCALKLAKSRGDARLEREAQLLARVQHPNVPGLRGHGEWYGHPYVVMDWVEGPSLYRWTQLSNPSWRQVAQLLAKVAAALAAVHAVGGAHRDMKGDNLLVRLADNEPMLTDFGAGTWQGAAPLTVEGPPGTPLYFSPERLRAHLNLLPPGSPSGAGHADDVYGLGVTAFRLLTDRYPFLELGEAQRTQERLQGRLPRPPHELNPRVPPQLGALVLRMMAAMPEERPPAHELARALEALAQGPEQPGEELLFSWQTEPSRLGPGQRLRSRMEYERLLAHARLEEGQARVAAELARVQAEQHSPSLPQTPPPPRSPPKRRARPQLRLAGAALVLGLLGASVLALVWRLEQAPSEPLAQGNNAQREDGDPVSMGDAALAAASSADPSTGAPSPEPSFSMKMPDKPLPRQKLPPCDSRWEVALNGGCWFPLTTVKPPCGTGEYEWQGGCYFPVRTAKRPTTSQPP